MISFVSQPGLASIILVPKTFADIAPLYSPILAEELCVAGYGLRLLPEDSLDYCDIMQMPPSHWDQVWETLQRMWPHVSASFLRYGRLSDLYRPPLLVANDPSSD